MTGHAPGDDRTADELARGVRRRLAREHDVFAVELLGAPGSGKTALVERLVDRAPPDERAAVVTGDDARRYRDRGVEAVGVSTGDDPHLDPARVDRALDDLDLGSLDTLFVENAGGMDRPADVPPGTHCRVAVVSVTEGEDVVREHPSLFRACDLAVVNKVDVAGAVGVDVGRMRADVLEVAPGLPVVTTSAATDAGLGTLDAEVRTRRARYFHLAD